MPIVGHLANCLGRLTMVASGTAACGPLAVPLFVLLRGGTRSTDL